MSSRKVIVPGLAIVCCAALVVLQSHPVAAQQSSIDFSVSGTSTIRGWTCTVAGVVDLTPGNGSIQAVPYFADGVQAATLRVPVNAFECPVEEMTEQLLEAMKADQFSEIVFRLEGYRVSDGQAEATGTITITDVTAPISVPIALEASGESLEIEGTTRLDMTDFGVEPPVLMFGGLQVRPQIRIGFQGVLAR